MLQRTSLLEKRKKKRAELDKLLLTAKNLVERDIKQSNKKGEDDYIDLEKLDPLRTKFIVSEELKTIMNQQIMRFIQDYVQINNEYIQVKLQEEKVKVSI
jgi:hypothetical protein